MPAAQVKGIKIDYNVDGSGKNLILIIGLGSDQSNWRLQLPSFMKQYRTITLDNRGSGKSDKPPGPYTTKMMAEDVVGLMDHLDVKKAHILGVSMGGMIAQEIAINHPDRVDKLVLGCTCARIDATSGFSMQVSEAIDQYRKSSSDLSTLRKVVYTILDSTFNKATYRILALPLMKTAISLSSLEGLDEQLEAVLAHNSAERLGTIHNPTLVIVGTDDRVIKPSSSDVLASLIPGARLVKVNGGSHGFSGEMSNEFNRVVLDFLRSY
jgi:3-oxoadipate enol-lactonase